MKFRKSLLLLTLLTFLSGCGSKVTSSVSSSNNDSVSSSESIQTYYTVKGYVINKSTRKRISGVDAILTSYDNVSKKEVTDDKGAFIFTDVLPGDYYITIVSNDKYNNYDDFDIEVGGDNTVIQLDLIELVETTITWGEIIG